MATYFQAKHSNICITKIGSSWKWGKKTKKSLTAISPCFIRESSDAEKTKQLIKALRDEIRDVLRQINLDKLSAKTLFEI